jgi:hypothetical protein
VTHRAFISLSRCILVTTLSFLPQWGCVVSRLRTSGASGAETSVSSYSVAWPWLDSTRSLRGADLGTGPDVQTLRLAGMSDSSALSSNAAAVIGALGHGIGAALISTPAPIR